jgi:K+-transporting ATPase ATPase C chain
MKQHILPSIKLTLLCLIFFSGAYTFLIWLFAQFSPQRGLGQTLETKGRVVGYALEGQSFTQDKYFWGRPSAIGYNAMGSGGSNKGPSNPDYLKDVQAKIDSFLVHNPGIKKEDIPSELVTSSGSGLDPDLSARAAYVQLDRVSKARKMDPAQIQGLVEKSLERPFLGLFGTEKINVLKLNLQLDQLSGGNRNR